MTYNQWRVETLCTCRILSRTNERVINVGRDLMKWLKRIAADFDVTRTSTGSMVLQEALDCFCCCITKPDKRLPVSVAMAAKLNIVRTTVS